MGRLVDRLSGKQNTFLQSTRLADAQLWPRPELGVGERAANHHGREVAGADSLHHSVTPSGASATRGQFTQRASPEGLTWSEWSEARHGGPCEQLRCLLPHPDTEEPRPCPERLLVKKMSHPPCSGSGYCQSVWRVGSNPRAEELVSALQPSCERTAQRAVRPVSLGSFCVTKVAGLVYS